MVPADALESSSLDFQSNALPSKLNGDMAGEEGVEPSLMVLETTVLPLNYSPIWCIRKDSNLRHSD